ncbi:MAG: 4Fe-4S dicluster domain-containing protein [Desulfobacterales bacterium]
MTASLYPPPVHPRALDHPASILPGPIPDESELTTGVVISPGKAYGFFTDTSLCIGCKACEVACKEWNLLPADRIELSGMSYDNTRRLSATTWRHVAFIERVGSEEGRRPTVLKPFQSHWLMMSDVCKHCERAGCLEACPTGAIFRTEFGSVVVQHDICNGCAYCVPSCPFGVIDINLKDGKAHKCTLCYDRLKGGLEPACAKACPTNSIQFGEVAELRARAGKRLEKLRRLGRNDAYLYGVPGAPGATGGIQGLNAFFLLLDRPQSYNLAVAPRLPAVDTRKSLGRSAAVLAGVLVAGALIFAPKHRREKPPISED